MQISKALHGLGALIFVLSVASLWEKYRVSSIKNSFELLKDQLSDKGQLGFI